MASRRLSSQARAPFRACGATDPGCVRNDNEDAFAIAGDLLVVSDGVGGAQAGATASKVVVDALPRAWDAAPSSRRRSRRDLLRDTVAELNRQIHDQTAGRHDLAGMGATLVAVTIGPRSAALAHMGDSRAYLWRAGELKRLTEDHSVVALLVQRGDIREDEAKTHPARHTLTRFMGMQGGIQPDVATLSWKRGDRLLLCTDGLTDMLADEEIANVLRDHSDPAAACAELIGRAKQAGGRDNITVVIADWCISRS